MNDRSRRRFSPRRSAYEFAVFRSDRIYTPPMVVDGTLEVLGSDAAAVRRAWLQAAPQPKATATVVALQLASDWKPVNLRSVGFVQEWAGRRSFGAGWSALRRDQ